MEEPWSFDSNTFFEQLDANNWDPENDFEYTLDEKLDIDLVHLGYTDLFYKKDFFFYMGS